MIDVKNLTDKTISPEWFYPLYKDSDKEVYTILLRLAKAKNYPKFKGAEEQLSEFLKLVVYSGKSRNYRKYRDLILPELEKEEIDLHDFIGKGKGLKIPHGVDESWAIFIQDKRICEILDDFYDAKIEFRGNAEETLEFLARYMLTQLLQDWRGPKLAVALFSLTNKRVHIKDLNQLLSHWDFTKIFSSYS